MSQTWYRGEGVGVPPAKPGAWLHDFGEGVYFADSVGLAKQYAQLRTPNVTDQRVYSLQIDMKSLRVLDLRTDARWLKYSAPLQPHLHVQQNYANAFSNFVRLNKIDMSKYDAVIGPEYVRGGTQMAILHHNGQTSPLAQQLRLKFQPVPLDTSLVPSTKVPTAKLQFRGKIGPGIKVVGGSFISIIVGMLLNWLSGKITEKIDEAELKKQMEEIKTRIERDMHFYRQRMVNMIAEGKQCWVVVRLHTAITYGPDLDPLTATPVQIVSYDGIFLSEKEVNKDEGTSIELVVTTAVPTHRFLTSFSVEFTDQEVAYYQAIKKELEWYDGQIDNKTDKRDVVRLSTERDGLLKRLSEAFAE